MKRKRIQKNKNIVKRGYINYETNKENRRTVYHCFLTKGNQKGNKEEGKKMREKEKCRKGNVQYFCMYTAGFLAVALLLLLIFAKEHASFTKMADGVAQHYAVLMWIRNTLRQFLHGNFALPMVVGWTGV